MVITAFFFYLQLQRRSFRSHLENVKALLFHIFLPEMELFIFYNVSMLSLLFIAMKHLQKDMLKRIFI